jgi:hypothetical protein
MCSHPRPHLSSTHNPYDDETHMMPHTCFGGCVAILGVFFLKFWVYHDAKRAALAALLALLLLFKKKTNIHCILGFFPLPNLIQECANKAQAKYGHVCSHPRPPLSSTCNPYDNETSMAPHTHFQRVCGYIKCVFLYYGNVRNRLTFASATFASTFGTTH